MSRITTVLCIVLLTGCTSSGGCSETSFREAQNLTGTYESSRTICWLASEREDTPHPIGVVRVTNDSTQPISVTFRIEHGSTLRAILPDQAQDIEAGKFVEFDVVADEYFERDGVLNLGGVLGHDDFSTFWIFEYTNICAPDPDPPTPPADIKVHDTELENADIPDGWSNMAVIPGGGSQGGGAYIYSTETGEKVRDTPFTPGFGYPDLFYAVAFEDLSRTNEDWTLFTNIGWTASLSPTNWGLTRLDTASNDANTVTRNAAGQATELWQTFSGLGQVRRSASGEFAKPFVYPFDLPAGETLRSAAPGPNDETYILTVDADDTTRLRCRTGDSGPFDLVREAGLGGVAVRTLGEATWTAQPGSNTISYYHSGEFVRDFSIGPVYSLSLRAFGDNTVLAVTGGQQVRFIRTDASGSITGDESRGVPTGMDRLNHVVWYGESGLIGTGALGSAAKWFVAGLVTNSFSLGFGWLEDGQ